jgi:hypothetical protein
MKNKVLFYIFLSDPAAKLLKAPYPLTFDLRRLTGQSVDENNFTLRPQTVELA